MNNEIILQSALKTLEIPSNIKIKLIKSKRAPPYSTLVICKPGPNGKSLEYIIEYRKNLNSDLLRHELCHLKLHLMGLPVMQADIDSPISLRGQVLNTLHEDYYVHIIMHHKFLQSFSSLIKKGLANHHHELHIHDEDNDDLQAWLLQMYVLKLAIFEVLGYDKEAEEIREEMDHLREKSHGTLYSYLTSVLDYLKTLPPLDKTLRELTVEEKGVIRKVIQSINNIDISR